MMMGYGYGSSLGWLGMGFGMIIHLAFTALIIMAVIWMYKSVFRSGCHIGAQTSALEILQQRYAKGEISRDEYLQMKKDLD